MGECAVALQHATDGMADGEPEWIPQQMREDNPAIHTPAGSAVTGDSGGGLDMVVLPAAVEGRDAVFRIAFLNQSSAPTAVALAARDTEDGLRFRIEPQTPVIVPARAVAVLATAHVAHKVRPLIGPPHPYAIEFRGQQLGRERTSTPDLVGQARFTYVPRIAVHRQPASRPQ